MAAACRLTTADPYHPSATSQPGMPESRGISKNSPDSRPIPVLPLTCDPHGWTTALGLSRGLRTRPISNRPHRAISNARPLHPLPEPLTDPDQITRLAIRRRDHLGGIIHEYQHAT